MDSEVLLLLSAEKKTKETKVNKKVRERKQNQKHIP